MKCPDCKYEDWANVEELMVCANCGFKAHVDWFEKKVINPEDIELDI